MLTAAEGSILPAIHSFPSIYTYLFNDFRNFACMVPGCKLGSVMLNNGRFPDQGNSGEAAGAQEKSAKQPLSKASAGPPGFEDMQSAPRFPIKLPISVKSRSGESHTETENISANGVLFQIDSDMPVGSSVDFTISLPADVVGADADVQLDCRGRVARSFMEDGRRGVGVVIDEYKFERR